MMGSTLKTKPYSLSICIIVAHFFVSISPVDKLPGDTQSSATGDRWYRTPMSTSVSGQCASWRISSNQSPTTLIVWLRNGPLTGFNKAFLETVPLKATTLCSALIALLQVLASHHQVSTLRASTGLTFTARGDCPLGPLHQVVHPLIVKLIHGKK